MKALVSGELTVFFWSFLCGILIAVCYDLTKTIYQDKYFCITVCNICDTLFILYASAVMIFVLFSVSGGYIRFYEFFGAFIGSILYKITLSRLITSIFVKIFNGIFIVFKFFLKILLTPLEFMYKIIYNTVGVLFCNTFKKCAAFTRLKFH